MNAQGFDVAIIGGGVAGSALTLALARTAPAGYRLALFDRNEPGPGTAYAPQSPSLLMNGPVRAMSPVPGDPGHFGRYLVDEPDDALVCRARYGAYVRATVASALASRRDFTSVQTEIASIESRQRDFILRAADGTAWSARNVVLALGNFAPSESFLPEAVREFEGYARDPWRVDVSAFHGNVALIGSRLTAMDVVALLDEAAFRGRIHLISRHGLLPLVEHPRVRGLDPSTLALDTSTPLTLLRSIRRAARSYPGDWRAVAEALRPITPAVWTQWSLRERRRFLRHLHSMWAIHRYRVPAATHAPFARLNALGRIKNHRARIASAAREGGRLRLELSSARTTTEIVVDHLVNCTGPEGNITRLGDPLVQSALEAGLIRADALRMGVDANDRLHVLGRDGRPNPRLYAMGPLLRGLWFETTAVPEITRHAEGIANDLLADRAAEITETAG